MATSEDLKLRPATGVPASFLHSDIILCCGEDPAELLAAVRSAAPSLPPTPIPHVYRCYAFWPFPTFTLVWTGIGTGCLEPLIKEILDGDVIKRIVLIGSAGLIQAESDPQAHGKVYLVNEAYLASCAIQRFEEDAPLRPRFEKLAQIELPHKATVSTDYYYGFSPQTSAYVIHAQAADPRLRAAVERFWQPGRLIEMETGQFYHFCQVNDSFSQLQFLALQGVANLSDRSEEQAQHSLGVLRQAFAQATHVLRKTAQLRNKR